MQRQRKEFPHALNSRTGSRAGCPLEEQKTTYFKLTLHNKENELKVAVWASMTLEHFLLHICSAVHAFKQMGHDTSFTKAATALENAALDIELMKRENTYSKHKTPRRANAKVTKVENLRLLHLQ